MSNLRRNGVLRWAPSYLRNRGQMTRAQKRAYRELWDDYGIRFEHGKVIEPATHFELARPLLIEIGFGMGDHLVHLAKSLPETPVLGIEVHRPGIAAAIIKAREAGVKNLRVMRGDARLILEDHFQGEIATAFFIQCPDPWPKPGDEHRRLVQTEMVSLLRDRLESEGELLIATDVEAYADHCRDVMKRADGWESREASLFSEYRIPTNYERKGIEEGRAMHELYFAKKRE